MVEDGKRRYSVRGDRVGLAESRPEDERLNFENWQDPVVQRAYNSPCPWKDLGEYLAPPQSPERPCARFRATIVRVTDLRPLGVITLAPEDRAPDLAINVYREYRGQGYGTEAFKLALGYVFREFDLEFVVAGAYNHNGSSIGMLGKLGFRRCPDEGCVEESRFGDGQIRQLAFRLERSDWDIQPATAQRRAAPRA